MFSKQRLVGEKKHQKRRLYLLLSKFWYYERPPPPQKKGGLHIQQTKTGGVKSKQNWHLIVKSWYYERSLSSPHPQKKGAAYSANKDWVGKNENIIDILLLNLDIMKRRQPPKKQHTKKQGRGCMFSKQRLFGGNKTEPTSSLIVKQILILWNSP